MMLLLPNSSSRPASMSAAALVRHRVSALGSSLSLATASEPITEDQEFCQVEALQEQGEVAAKNGRHKDAVKIFAEALEIDATQFQIRAFKVRQTSPHCSLKGVLLVTTKNAFLPFKRVYSVNTNLLILTVPRESERSE